MDGYAVRAADVASGSARLRVTGEVTAGHVWPGVVGVGEAVRTMTGAPIPSGTDAIVPVELTRSEAGDTAGRFAPRGSEGPPSPEFVVVEEFVNVERCEGWTPGRHVLRRGASARAGDEVLEAGCDLPRGISGCWQNSGGATCSCTAGRAWRFSRRGTNLFRWGAFRAGTDPQLQRNDARRAGGPDGGGARSAGNCRGLAR